MAILWNLVLPLALLGAPETKAGPDLWLYYSTNLWVDANINRMEEVWRRAAKAGYYDGEPAQVKKWLGSASKVKGIIGVMYTTWQSRFDDLEAFARHCQRFRNRG